jgi:hypothetical protein
MALTLKIVGKIHPSITPIAANNDLPKQDFVPAATPPAIAEAIELFLEFYPTLLTKSLAALWDQEARAVEVRELRCGLHRKPQELADESFFCSFSFCVSLYCCFLCHH